MARRLRNSNRRKSYGGTSVSCQTSAFQEEMYTNLGNKWDSSQEKEGEEAANKPKGNVWASVQDHVRNDPEVFFRGEGEPCSLVIWVKIMGRKCKAVVDSGAQVTVINKDCFKEYMRGKPCRPARLKGVAKDNLLMAEVVDEVEIELGGISKKNRVFVANISNEFIIGLDTMRMFKMILDVGKGMVGVNGKVLPGCFKYVGGAEVPLYPVETVRRVELEPSSVTKIPVTVKGDPKWCWIREPGFPDCRFFMPSAVMGPSKEGYVWVINDAEDKMYVPEGTIMGIGQDWEEEQEIVEYSEPMGAVRGVGEGIPEHIKDMFDRASAGVGEDEAVVLKLLLIKYRGDFAEHDMDLGDFSALKHVIDTRDARPVKQRPRRTPLAFEGRRKNTLKNIWDAGIISRGVSEWASPTVLVRKRDGTVR